MLKVLLVDDEYYFRESMKIILPWEELGFTICGEARNGQVALDMVAQTLPDILIADINMPIMDGLELAQTLKERNPEIKIVILTGYGEFNYARQAVELGVSNFLVKPVDRLELKEVLLKLKNQIEYEQSKRYEVENLKKNLHAQLPLARYHILHSILKNELRPENPFWKEKFSYLNIGLDALAYRVFVFEIDHLEKHGWNEEDRLLWRFAMENIASEVLSTEYQMDTCLEGEGRVICITSSSRLEDSENNSFDCSERIRRYILHHLKFTVSIGIGKEYPDSEGIQRSYHEAQYALKNKLSLGENHSILYTSVAENSIIESYYSDSQKSKLLLALRTYDKAEATECIKDIFAPLRSRKFVTELLHVSLVDITSTLLEFLAEINLPFKQILGETSSLFSKLWTFKSLDDMENFFITNIDKVLSSASESRNNRKRSLVTDAMNYLETHFMDTNLKMEDVAAQIFVNPNYLSMVFRKETGNTLIETLTSIRLSKAKQMMDQGYSSIPNVSEKVGYMDPNYFSRCFKIKYGTTPSRYIENIEGK